MGEGVLVPALYTLQEYHKRGGPNKSGLYTVRYGIRTRDLSYQNHNEVQNPKKKKSIKHDSSLLPCGTVCFQLVVVLKLTRFTKKENRKCVYMVFVQ